MSVVSIRFGNCHLAVDERRLFRGSREVHLSPKAFELLKLLVDVRPRALSKSELLERVWPGIFVSEASLARVVNQIRNAVGDSARDARIVRTVHRYGYAFVAEVVEDARAATRIEGHRRSRCWLVSGRREFPLGDGVHIVGREPDAAVWLESTKVSRQHARLTVTGACASIEDLSSKNGTWVRGDRISALHSLAPGDEIQIGPFTLVFHVGIEPRSTETEITSAGRRK